MIESDASLGAAKVLDDSSDSFISVVFLNSREERNYTRKNPPFKRIKFHVGQKVTCKNIGEVTVEKIEELAGIFHFQSDGGSFSEDDICDIVFDFGLTDLLRQSHISQPKDLQLRQDVSRLLDERESHPFKGIAGCRVELLPHQIWVANKACSQPKIRALLADEVGLGKTIEAGLIFSSLHAQKELNKVLILVPEALKVQWLTEFYRRFNVRFRLDHEEIIDGSDHRDYVIASLGELEKNISEFDLIIVDEAHRLCRDSEKRDLLKNLVDHSKHVLFLSATPRIYGEEAYQGMLEILKDKDPVQIFQSKRKELNFPSMRQLEAQFVKNKTDWLVDFLRNHLENSRDEKIFMIGSSQESVVQLFKMLSQELGDHFALFHEGMDLIERDRQAAYFSSKEGAPILISSEIGGEGRNFQFCHHMVMLDLPNDPLTIEQRIGRLDRIGQKSKISVWCPVEEDSQEEKYFEVLKDTYRVFEEPWTGSGRADFINEESILSGASQDDFKSNELSQFMKYDESEAHCFLEQTQDLDDVVVNNVLESIYDLFGVEVEDYDSQNNWKVSLTAQSFVDYFPGIGSEGERVITFDRLHAVTHEDYTFYSVDHPDFIEAAQFFLNSNHGRIGVAELNPSQERDLYLLLQTRNKESQALRHKLWKYSSRSLELLQGVSLESSPYVKNYPQSFQWKQLPEEFFEQISQTIETQIKLDEGEELDSLLLICPTED